MIFRLISFKYNTLSVEFFYTAKKKELSDYEVNGLWPRCKTLKDGKDSVVNNEDKHIKPFCVFLIIFNKKFSFLFLIYFYHNHQYY